jgi:hypothetical protein
VVLLLFPSQSVGRSVEEGEMHRSFRINRTSPIIVSPSKIQIPVEFVGFVLMIHTMRSGTNNKQMAAMTLLDYS